MVLDGTDGTGRVRSTGEISIDIMVKAGIGIVAIGDTMLGDITGGMGVMVAIWIVAVMAPVTIMVVISIVGALALVSNLGGRPLVSNLGGRPLVVGI